MCQTRWMCNKGRRNRRVVKIDRSEGERENNSFWYIKETIERLINEAYRIRKKENNDHLCGWLGWCEGEGCKERRV